MTPFLNVVAVVALLSWTLIIINILNDLRRMLERERSERPPKARNRKERQGGRATSRHDDRKVLKGKH